MVKNCILLRLVFCSDNLLFFTTPYQLFEYEGVDSLSIGRSYCLCFLYYVLLLQIF